MGVLAKSLPCRTPGTFKSYVLSGQIKADESGDGLPGDTCLFITEGDMSVGSADWGICYIKISRVPLRTGKLLLLSG